MRAQACEHDMDAEIALGDRVGAAGDESADGLQDEADEVAADEDVGVYPEGEGAVGYAEDDDNALHAEVERCAQECGADC